MEVEMDQLLQWNVMQPLPAAHMDAAGCVDDAFPMDFAPFGDIAPLGAENAKACSLLESFIMDATCDNGSSFDYETAFLKRTIDEPQSIDTSVLFNLFVRRGGEEEGDDTSFGSDTSSSGGGAHPDVAADSDGVLALSPSPSSSATSFDATPMLTHHHHFDSPMLSSYASDSYPSSPETSIAVLDTIATLTALSPLPPLSSPQLQKRRRRVVTGSQNGGKPHKCDHCDLSFRRSHDLKRHELVKHSTARAFVCENCGSSFARNDSLMKHMRGEAKRAAKRAAKAAALAAGGGTNGREDDSGSESD